MPDAIPGRETVDIEIFGMEGIPAEDVEAKVGGLVACAALCESVSISMICSLGWGSLVGGKVRVS